MFELLDNFIFLLILICDIFPLLLLLDNSPSQIAKKEKKGVKK